MPHKIELNRLNVPDNSAFRLQSDSYLNRNYSAPNKLQVWCQKYTSILLPPVPAPPIPEKDPDVEYDGEYEKLYYKNPAWPIFIVLISMVQIILFIVDYCTKKKESLYGEVAELLMYNPMKQAEFWRYLTYMLVHVGWHHIVSNISIQIVLGIPLEIIHKHTRVFVIYICGVLAGSLGASITTPNAGLVGASGACYALLTAHMASIIMNWKEMSYPAFEFTGFSLLICGDFGYEFYRWYTDDINNQLSLAAHVCGAITGLLVGFSVLKYVKTPNRIIRVIGCVLFVLLLMVGIIWNVLIFWKKK